MIEVARAMRGGMGAVGHLPFAGGYADQPARLMQICRAIGSLLARLDAERSARPPAG